MLFSLFPWFQASSEGEAKEIGDKTIDFEVQVAPILAARCIECHHHEEKSGGLELSTHSGLSAGGDSGKVIDPQNPSSSILLQKIVDGEMPPAQQGISRKLPDSEIEVLRKWIEEGPSWPSGRVLDLYEQTNALRGGRDWWSFQPLKYVELKNSAAMHPVDSLIAGTPFIQEHGQAPTADKRTLIRRAYQDLIGLPPTFEEIEAFEKDDSPEAWPRLIDRLLASPHYGERWARYWLDVVRFAETCGYERDQVKPGIWRYRDWVVQALNSDMPYNEFVTMQLAGDEVPNRSEQTVIATGMIRAGTWNDEPNDSADYEYERLEDMVNTCSTAFLGLTVRCARCHDHKFDPIPQRDYYRFASFFWAGYIGQANLGGPSTEQLGFDVFGWTDRGPTASPIHLLHKGERSQPRDVVKPGFLSAIPMLDKDLLSPESLDASQPPTTTRRRIQWANWMTSKENPLTPRVIVNRIWLQHFGKGIVRTPDNFGFKGDLPTHPELLDWLATELISPQYGIINNASAKDQAWRLKRIHRLIMTSNTYMQASTHPKHDALKEIDSGNKNWWHFERRRLDAEGLRDAMLKVSGRWNPAIGGPSFYPSMASEALEGLSRKDGDWKPSPPEDQNRRSLYMMTKRSRLLPFMTTFDFTDTISPCGQRDSTNVAPQALALLNNEFVHEQSRALADRSRSLGGGSLDNRIRFAWRYALGRNPTVQELESSRRHVDAQSQILKGKADAGDPNIKVDQVELLALASLCHVLLNANEFLYID